MPELYRRKRLPYGFTFLDASGTRQLKERSIIAEKILEKNQYQPVTPATIDFQDTFEVFGREDVFHLKDHLGDRLALRNDVTVQIIKGFCNQLEKYDTGSQTSRYYYNVPVFTDIRKSYPALREVQQLGAEMIGMDSEKAILEIICNANQILTEAFSMPYRLILGDVRVFYYIQDWFSSDELKNIFLRKDVSSLTTFMIRQGWEEKTAAFFSHHLLYYKGEKSFNASMDDIQTKLDDKKKDFVNNIRKILMPVIQLKQKLEAQNVMIDIEPLLLRYPKYYTGFLFEGYVHGLSFPPLRGGSYDQLISEYSNQSYPASGFALDMSSLLR